MRISLDRAHGREVIVFAASLREQWQLDRLAHKSAPERQLPLRGLMIGNLDIALPVALRFAQQHSESAEQRELASRLLKENLTERGMRFLVWHGIDWRVFGLRIRRGYASEAQSIPS